ncbi:MAG: hypothetical protein AB1297_05865 [bacterium]
MEKLYFKLKFIYYFAFCILHFAFCNGYCLTIEPFWSRIGEKVLISGEGYKRKEDITLNFEKKTFKLKASLQGTFSLSFIIQSQPGGKKVIIASSKTKKETASFWVKPKIKVYPLKGTRGTKVNISGEGYSFKERIQIGLGRNSAVAWGTASSLGTFSATFTIANQPYGTQSLFAVGHNYYLDDRKDFFVEPVLSVVPRKGVIGSLVTISGTGFFSSEGPPPGEPIIIDFGTHRALMTDYTNYYGSFEIPLNVPSCKGGLVDVSVRGGYSGLVCSSNFDIAPRISSFPNTGEPTRPLTIKGDGFSKYETITITFEKRREGTRTLTQREEFLADENGSFKLDFLVDTQPKGVKRVTIKGEFGFYEKRNLEIKPCVDVVEVDRKGGTLTLKGGGFLPYEDVTLGFGGPRCIGKVSTDKDGFFLKTFIFYGIQEKEEIIASSTKSNEVIIIQVEAEK